MAVRHSIYSTKPDFLGVEDKTMCRTVSYFDNFQSSELLCILCILRIV